MEKKKKQNYLEIGFHFDSIDKIPATVKRDMIVHALEMFETVFGEHVLGYAMSRFLDNKLNL